MTFPRWLSSVLVATCLLLGALVGVFAYRSHSLQVNQAHLTEQLASTTAAYTTATLQLASTTAENTALSDALIHERARSDEYTQQVTTLNGTVDTLTKLTTIDPQLLAKYSKVYFLNENYTPASIATISPELTFDQKRTYRFEGEALPFLDDLLADANNAGTKLLVVSAYRSFREQSALKAQYRVTYGAGSANSFSADQGYSEHQLGTTVDFTTGILGANFTTFDKSDAYQWLLENAYKYGFVISYPKSNGYYTYEPWHWRFVGVALATELHSEGKHFYDLDQRTISSYLVHLFDR